MGFILSYPNDEPIDDAGDSERETRLVFPCVCRVLRRKREWEGGGSCKVMTNLVLLLQQQQQQKSSRVVESTHLRNT